MDLAVVAFLLVIVLAGGLIGVLADNLGRRVGKKKLSLARMRPKHFARLVTFVAGSASAAITIFLVYVFSSDVRQWINEGRKAILEATDLTRQKVKLTTDVSSLSTKVDSLNEKEVATNRRLRESQLKLAGVRNRLHQLNLRLIDANRRAKEANQRIAVAQAALARDQVEIAQREAAVRVVTKKLAGSRANYTDLISRFKTLNGLRVEADAEVLNLQTKADDLVRQINQLKGDSLSLHNEIADNRTQLATAQAELSADQASLQTTRVDLTEALTRLDEAKQQAQSYRLLTAASRTEPLVFPKGEELARVPLDPNRSKQDATEALERLLRETRAAASLRGANPAPGGVYTAGLVAQVVNGTPVTVEAQEAAIVDGLTGNNSNLVLVSYALFNSFKREFVPIEVKGYPNPVVYKKGHVIAETHFGRGMTREKVLEQLTEFLKNTVVSRALADGMIPFAGKQDSLIDVPASQTVEVVEQLTKSERAVRLQVVSEAETRAADQMQLGFVIK